MKITVFGMGYVGLVQAAVFAQAGHEVCCVDIDQTKIDGLFRGKMPFYEPDLERTIIENRDKALMTFTTHAQTGVEFSNLYFITVNVPVDIYGNADIRNVLNVAKTIGEFMKTDSIVILKSTAPVGTAEKVETFIKEVLEQRPIHHEVEVVSNPEFLREGTAVRDCAHPDRVVIGTTNSMVKELLSVLYKPNKIIFMDRRSAEMTKYAANCMLATKISFMNEMANIAELSGADIKMVRDGIGSDSRIGPYYINPGCGYGGSCLPKDLKALTAMSYYVGHTPSILEAVERVNKDQKNTIWTKIVQYYDYFIKGKKFAIWGLAFKPGTDDVRNAPSHKIIMDLLGCGATVTIYDPKAMEEFQKVHSSYSGLQYAPTAEAALEDANALVICTEWFEFKNFSLKHIKQKVKDKVIFDGRNVYDPKQMEAEGIEYYGIGRGKSIKTPGGP